MDAELDALRTQLARVDRKILDLVAEREKLASRIGSVKRAAALPTRDFSQERDVVERARERALELGLSPRFAEELMLLLIRSSLTVQERESIKTVAGGSGKRALVIGGVGKMGRWFVSFLRSQGFAVDVADPASEAYQSWKQIELFHDVIVIAAPLVVANEILLEMSRRPPRGLVFDIGSLKSPVRDGLRAMAAAGANVTSVHPMFGPDTELLSGRHVVFVDVGVPAATDAAMELFRSTLAVRVDMDLESHDRLIAYVLGLSHALNIAFFTALAESGERAPELAKLSSTTFDEQLLVSKKVAGENPRLYFEIQSLNDYGTEALAALLYAVERIRSVVRAGDEAGFAALMERGKAYLSGR
ncbi:MAG TPA: prephenate dehydrogenase/arogenate dehydrogenase family protein [Vicinamibacteria bacterium]|nr:prephenate dehydrogenase/arogenate dehydrogenase family protein [Vicinamibacteria bacterium]